jgi:predicted neuraminidase
MHAAHRIAMAVLMMGLMTSTMHAQTPNKDAEIVREFLYETASFPSCHASTIAETKSGLVAAWFGGSDEGEPDVGIWVSRHQAGKWTPPVEVANGVQTDGKRFPCWNPVLFTDAKSGLMLFYKVGPNPRQWWGMLRTSDDGGETWSPAQRLPNGILGPIKNKPLKLRNGTLLSPTSTEHDGWKVYLELTKDGGKSWLLTPPLNDGKTIRAIQPGLMQFPDGRLMMLCRGTAGKLLASQANKDGTAWEPLRATDIPNPNSGIDTTVLADGRALLVYNPTDVDDVRTPLSVALSRDGIHWKPVFTLEDAPGEYSYPAVIQTKDRRIHITYTWKRERIRHVVLDPTKLPLE